MTVSSFHPPVRFPILILLLASFALATAATNADNPSPNVAHETKSANGRFVIRMNPASNWGHEGTGVVLEVTDTGERELWSVDWFAQEVELSDSGEHLVRYGPWASDLNHHTDLAIAFYHRGKLLKSYRVADLIRDPEALVYSMSHYIWRAAEQSAPNGFTGDNGYHLVMADKTAYDFDLATGEIRRTDVDPSARNETDLWKAEREEAKQRGQRLYETSDVKQRFAPHLRAVGIEAGRGKVYGVHFDGPEWRADFVPVRGLAHDCMVEAIFPLVDGERIEAQVTPEQILSGMQRALKHPFVARRFEGGGATRLRMRITGDRLHWKTREVRRFLHQLDHADRWAADLGHWGYFIIDAAEPRYTSVYLNVETGELIYEDKSTWPWEPVLVEQERD